MEGGGGIGRCRNNALHRIKSWVGSRLHRVSPEPVRENTQVIWGNGNNRLSAHTDVKLLPGPHTQPLPALEDPEVGYGSRAGRCGMQNSTSMDRQGLSHLNSTAPSLDHGSTGAWSWMPLLGGKNQLSLTSSLKARDDGQSLSHCKTCLLSPL